MSDAPVAVMDQNGNSGTVPLREDATVAKNFQLELNGTEAEDQLDKKVDRRDAIKMDEFDEARKLSRYVHEAKEFAMVHGLRVISAAAKKRLEEKQLELYMGGE